MGHLITLKQGLLSIADKRIVSENMFEGIIDELRILSKKIKISSLQKFQTELSTNYLQNIDTPESIKKYLDQLEVSLTSILNALPMLRTVIM